MNKLVSISVKGTKTVAKSYRDAVVADVKVKGLVVGETALTLTPNGTYAVTLSVCPVTKEVTYLVFGKPVVTANDPFAKKVAKVTPVADEAAPTVPAVSL